MGYLLSEQEFLNDNIFKYEEKMNSQYSRFLDKSPTYVTYYNISNINSTVDNGFENVEELIGPNSPIRFNKVDNFPIYGIDQIVLDLNDEDEGLTTEYDGEAIILPNTVQPIPGDFFIINHLQIKVQFMVTDIKYDTIRSNNFYKISFTLKTISEPTELENQVSDKFKCITDNIGTQDKCLIKEDEFFILQKISIEYSRLADMYKALFYNSKYNTFMINEQGINFYDPYLSIFLRDNKLFSQKNEYKTIYPEVIGNSNLINIYYNTSIYKALELGKSLPEQTYNLDVPTDFSSPFYYYSVGVLHIKFPGEIPYLPIDLINLINTYDDTLSYTYINKIISKYVNGLLDTPYTINVEELSTVYITEITRPNMILFGILLFILKKSYHRFIGLKN